MGRLQTKSGPWLIKKHRLSLQWTDVEFVPHAHLKCRQMSENYSQLQRFEPCRQAELALPSLQNHPVCSRTNRICAENLNVSQRTILFSGSPQGTLGDKAMFAILLVLETLLHWCSFASKINYMEGLRGIRVSTTGWRGAQWDDFDIKRKPGIFDCLVSPFRLIHSRWTKILFIAYGLCSFDKNNWTWRISWSL